MRVYSISIALFIMVLLFSQCNPHSEAAASNKKDLDQNMLDMMMYHDNLGIHLRQGEADYASWLLEGMDSSLQVIATKFDQHRKLTEPFEKTYQKKLQPPIKEMRQALEEKNMQKAIGAYRLLTKNCNSCHIDHEIDKEVFDLTDSSYN